MSDSLQAIIEKAMHEAVRLYSAQENSWAKCAKHVADTIAQAQKPVKVSLMYTTERLRDKFIMSQNSEEISIRWKDLTKTVIESLIKQGANIYEGL